MIYLTYSLLYFCFVKESATLANRLIEGQVSNAQYAEESYQLKRENCTLKKQLDEKLNNKTFSSSAHNSVQLTSPTELEMLRETVDKLTMVNRKYLSSYEPSCFSFVGES